MHVWSNVTFNGGRDVKVAAPFGQPAVFLVDDAAERVPELGSLMEFVVGARDAKFCV